MLCNRRKYLGNVGGSEIRDRYTKEQSRRVARDAIVEMPCGEATDCQDPSKGEITEDATWNIWGGI